MKELIFEDKTEFEKYIQKLENEVIPGINKFLEAYSSLKMDDLTKEDLSLYTGNSNARIKIREQYEATVWGIIRKLKIDNPTIQRNLISSIDIDLEPVFIELSKLFAIGGVSDVSIINNKAVLTDEDRAKVLERYKIYIENETEKEYYELLKSLEQGYNNLQQFVGAHKRENVVILPRFEQLSYFFRMIDKGAHHEVEINPGSVNIIRQ